ncbi:universal stress protein [Halostella litorea]|uniref:universal stress protein n=1 Tax=Halostella litorea TaxID=2528831 RepID=UPI001091AEAA|nr:universal stress protein [Halostella litorea]
MTRVLVSLAVLEGETVSSGLVDLLATVDVTVLGYHEVPEQTPPDQARAQFEDRAVDALEDVTREFREAGGDADYRLVFTHDRGQSVRRVAAETGADAYAITGVTGPVERLLVPVSGGVNVERILGFVEALVDSRDIGVTLLLVTDGDGAGETVRSAAADLERAGVDVTTREVSGDPVARTVEEAPGHDAVVMGERAPSLSSLVFGAEADRIAAGSVGPVLVVRGDEAADAPAE